GLAAPTRCIRPRRACTGWRSPRSSEPACLTSPALRRAFFRPRFLSLSDLRIALVVQAVLADPAAVARAGGIAVAAVERDVAGIQRHEGFAQHARLDLQYRPAAVHRQHLLDRCAR